MDRSAINQLFKSQFGQAEINVQAPGRINLIGEHTDYNHGLVLPAAIDGRIYFALNKNGKNLDQVEAYAADFDQKGSYSLSEKLSKKQTGWIHYLQAVTSELQERGYTISGFNCAFGGDIPIGAGLSSSAALTCGLVVGLAEMFDWDLPKKEIALIAQAAEHRVGIHCGLMDQYAVLFGQKGKVIQLDCRNLQVDYFRCELEDYCLLLLNTKVEHQLAATGYNDRRASCERVLAKVQQQYQEVNTLRDVTPTMLQNTNGLAALDIQRVRFVEEENERVRRMTIALQQGELEEAGALLYQSHHGLSKAYEVSCSELDVLVNLAKREPAILGARMMGGGFGGCTINLVKTAEVQKIATDILAAYKAITGIEGASYVVNIGNGVTVEKVD